jgi:hypothetical protein
MCFAGYRERIRFFHSAMGVPYFFSIEGKYEAGPVTLLWGEAFLGEVRLLAICGAPR